MINKRPIYQFLLYQSINFFQLAASCWCRLKQFHCKSICFNESESMRHSTVILYIWKMRYASYANHCYFFLLLIYLLKMQYCCCWIVFKALNIRKKDKYVYAHLLTTWCCNFATFRHFHLTLKLFKFISFALFCWPLNTKINNSKKNSA